MARVVTFGEIMLRLKSPHMERLLQSPLLEATFGGSEANVAVALAQFGLDVAFVSVLPPNPLGEACIGELRRFGVDVSLIARTGERIGIYYFENGANQRPATVIYDRQHSAFAEATPNSFDWARIFAGASWFHISGITPALTENSAAVTLQAVSAAKELGLTVSCDYNYRSKLWSYGKSAPEVMGAIVRNVDVLIANAQDCQEGLGLRFDDGPTAADNEKEAGDEDPQRYTRISQSLFAAFPNLTYHAMTLRESHSASHNDWSAYLADRHQPLMSNHYAITHIVDRVGAGDAFAAGLIYGLTTHMKPLDTLNFAVAASALKHTIPGDVNRVSVAEVQSVMAGNISGRVQR